MAAINARLRPIYHCEVAVRQALQIGSVERFLVLEQLMEQVEGEDVKLRVADLLHTEHLLVLREDRL